MTLLILYIQLYQADYGAGWYVLGALVWAVHLIPGWFTK